MLVEKLVIVHVQEVVLHTVPLDAQEVVKAVVKLTAILVLIIVLVVLDYVIQVVLVVEVSVKGLACLPILQNQLYKKK